MKRGIFTQAFWSRRDVEMYIGKLLRYGVELSSIITVFGGILYILQHRGKTVNYSPVPQGYPFSGAQEYLRNLDSVWNGMLRLDGASVIQFGVFVLIATPILRVLFSAFAFLIEKDYLYVIITLIVFFIILSNMIFGINL